MSDARSCEQVRETDVWFCVCPVCPDTYHENDTCYVDCQLTCGNNRFTTLSCMSGTCGTHLSPVCIYPRSQCLPTILCNELPDHVVVLIVLRGLPTLTPVP